MKFLVEHSAASTISQLCSLQSTEGEREREREREREKREASPFPSSSSASFALANCCCYLFFSSVLKLRGFNQVHFNDFSVSVYQPNSCGTQAPVWLELTDGLPEPGQEKESRACASWTQSNRTNCCFVPFRVTTRNCNDFLIYRLSSTRACNIAYCVKGKKMLFVGCLKSQQHASVSQGRICTENFTCCHTEIEVVDQTFYLAQSQYTDTGPTSPSADPVMPGAWHGSHRSANF